MTLAIVIFLFHIGLGIALHIYRRRHPPLVESTGGFGSTLRALREIWGASLWPLMALLWITTPLFKAAHPNAPVGWVLFSIGLTFPIFIYIIPLVVSGLMRIGCLIALLLPTLGFFIIVALLFLLPHNKAIWVNLLPFAFFMLAPPLLATLLLLSWGVGILPVNPQQETPHRNALALILGFFSGSPKPMQRIINNKVKVMVAGDPIEGLGPGWVMTEVHNAVVLKGRTAIRRVVGPDSVFTQREEIPYEVLDLRQQMRQTHVQAITRDGIKVRLRITLVFQIQPGHHILHFDRPWPYAREAAWHAVFASEVNPEGRTPLDAHLSHPWSDIPLEVAKSILKQTVIDFTLEQLYQTPGDTAISTRRTLADCTRARLSDILAPKGFHIVQCTISTIKPVESAVTEQRIKAWKARWIQQLVAWQGAAQAQRFEYFAAIQNRARLDLLSQFIQTTHDILQQSDQATARSLVAYTLLDNMERLAREPEIQTYLPDTALSSLTELRQRVSKDKAV